VFIKIRMFFCIAIGGISAFSIAFLHLLRSCPFMECDTDTEFPLHFYRAVSTTLLYMGGQYSSIEKELTSENWAFQTLMIVFFFFTVVLLLNVLIALINQAFNDGDGTWRLMWLQNRLHVIESVENLSFHIPGFREHHNYFPDVIYYSATDQEIEDFKAKYTADFSTSKADKTPMSKEELQEEIRDALQEQSKVHQKQISTMKEEIQQQIHAALQEQMKEFKAMLAEKTKVEAGPS
ncbi:hypothetical protein BGZ50_009839, partial [Haplosporangium sp. Z 11]